MAAVGAAVVSLIATGLVAMPAATAVTGTITCAILSPGNPVVTPMDTSVSGQVQCTHSGGLPVTYAVAPYVADETGPFNGKLTSFSATTGAFVYAPGWYPPDPVTGVTDKLPDFSGPDAFTVVATASDGAQASLEVPIVITAPAQSCSSTFVPTTQTMFNDPSSSDKKKYAMLRYLIKMINCTPARNADGTQATIRFSFYSLTYAPVQAALTAAAARGVSVQALTNSHADKYPAWKQLAATIGMDSDLNGSSSTFTATCWQGCLTPRTPPVAGGPTAWYSAEATTLTGQTVVFADRSLRGSSAITSWHWDFGDGTTADGPGPFTKTYTSLGTYRTSLTVTDANGVSHTTYGSKTLPDNKEPEYPSLHSKIYLFSTVGTGSNARQWISAYSSGNPTYQQSRKGFNNLNIAVGDKPLYTIFNNYLTDLVKASRGQLLTTNYFRSFATPGSSAAGTKATTVHLGPQTDGGDINVDILKTVQCRYKANGVWKRTDLKVSMFVFSRKSVAAQLWRLVMREGCNVEIVYTEMSQRLRGADGKWIAGSDGEPTGYGVADCLSTPATKVIVKPAKRPGRPAKRKVVRNNLQGPDGWCSGGSLKGAVPVTTSGTWLDRTSPITGGRLIVRMSCPVAPKYNAVTKTWAVVCLSNDLFTHQKVLLVKGYIHGRYQRYVMTGSANWSTPGLRESDEVITEIQKSKALYNAYLANFTYMKSVVAKNSLKRSTKSSYVLSLSDSQQLDVRGLTAEQRKGQAG